MDGSKGTDFEYRRHSELQDWRLRTTRVDYLCEQQHGRLTALPDSLGKLEEGGRWK